MVVAVFLVSATAAAVFNHEGNAGAKVAEAASRVDRQGDDTQAVCTDIRELILEQKNLAAVSPESYANESTSGNNSEFKYASPNDSSNDSAICRKTAAQTTQSTTSRTNAVIQSTG